MPVYAQSQHQAGRQNEGSGDDMGRVDQRSPLTPYRPATQPNLDDDQ